MSDRELIELAAKAAGYCWTNIPERRKAGVIGLWLLDANGVLMHTCWNPLDDDGAALRLAVKLTLSIEMEDGTGKLTAYTGAYGYGPGKWAEIEHGADPYAATRRAIVRAAAEIGKK